MEAAKSQRELAEEWMGFVFQNWKKQLKRHKIKSSGDLEQSFIRTVVAGANGDLDRIKLAYAWYGQMVDMGVGRGTKSGSQKENATSRRLVGRASGNKRKPKRWYSQGRDSIGSQVNKLSHLLAESAAIAGTENIAGSIQKQLVINI